MRVILSLILSMLTVPAQAGIASLDYCADQYVMALADDAEIAALSSEARSAYSYFADRAARLPQTATDAESLLILHPDIVARQWGGGQGVALMLARFGIPVAGIGYGDDIATARANLLGLGARLGKVARAEHLVADMDARLARIAADRQPRGAALYLTPAGVTSGSGTFIDAMIRAAGYQNWAGDRIGWHPVDLEQLALRPPDLVIAGFFDLENAGREHWSVLHHPMIQHVLASTPVVEVPGRLIACGAWFFVDAVELIHQAKGNGR